MHGASKSAFLYTRLGEGVVVFDLHSRKKRGGGQKKIVFLKKKYLKFVIKIDN
jgi:hypothetical protein